MSAAERVAAEFLRSQPSAAARILETMDAADAAEVLAKTPPAVAAGVLQRMLPAQSARSAERLAADALARVVDTLPGLAGAALLRHLSADVREDVLRRGTPARAALLRMLLQYPESAIGAWMDPAILTFSSDYNLAQAREQLERAEHEHPKIYVLGRDRKLEGAVRRLALRDAAADAPVESLLEPVEPLWARESVAAAQAHELWEREIEAPVVNRQGEFVGSIAYADLRRAWRRLLGQFGAESATAESGELAELVSAGMRSTWRGLSEFLAAPGAGPKEADGERDG